MFTSLIEAYGNEDTFVISQCLSCLSSWITIKFENFLDVISNQQNLEMIIACCSTLDSGICGIMADLIENQIIIQREFEFDSKITSAGDEEVGIESNEESNRLDGFLNCVFIFIGELGGTLESYDPDSEDQGEIEFLPLTRMVCSFLTLGMSCMFYSDEISNVLRTMLILSSISDIRCTSLLVEVWSKMHQKMRGQIRSSDLYIQSFQELFTILLQKSMSPGVDNFEDMLDIDEDEWNRIREQVFSEAFICCYEVLRSQYLSFIQSSILPNGSNNEDNESIEEENEISEAAIEAGLFAIRVVGRELSSRACLVNASSNSIKNSAKIGGNIESEDDIRMDSELSTNHLEDFFLLIISICMNNDHPHFPVFSTPSTLAGFCNVLSYFSLWIYRFATEELRESVIGFLLYISSNTPQRIEEDDSSENERNQNGGMNQLSSPFYQASTAWRNICGRCGDPAMAVKWLEQFTAIWDEVSLCETKDFQACMNLVQGGCKLLSQIQNRDEVMEIAHLLINPSIMTLQSIVEMVMESKTRDYLSFEVSNRICGEIRVLSMIIRSIKTKISRLGTSSSSIQSTSESSFAIMTHCWPVIEALCSMTLNEDITEAVCDLFARFIVFSAGFYSSKSIIDHATENYGQIPHEQEVIELVQVSLTTLSQYNPSAVMTGFFIEILETYGPLAELQYRQMNCGDNGEISSITKEIGNGIGLFTEMVLDIVSEGSDERRFSELLGNFFNLSEAYIHHCPSIILNSDHFGNICSAAVQCSVCHQERRSVRESIIFLISLLDLPQSVANRHFENEDLRDEFLNHLFGIISSQLFVIHAEALYSGCFCGILGLIPEMFVDAMSNLLYAILSSCAIHFSGLSPLNIVSEDTMSEWIRYLVVDEGITGASNPHLFDALMRILDHFSSFATQENRGKPNNQLMNRSTFNQNCKIMWEVANGKLGEDSLALIVK